MTVQRLNLPVLGMSCASCVQSIKLVEDTQVPRPPSGNSPTGWPANSSWEIKIMA